MLLERVTVRVPEEQLEEVESLVDDGEFPNRSEAIRAAIGDLLDGHRNRQRLVADGGEVEGKTLVIVGCGAAKLDQPARAKDLYTSTYFKKKRGFAELVGDHWKILSAEHGLVPPLRPTAPYETAIDDLDADALDDLATQVGLELSTWVKEIDSKSEHGVAGVVVLAGRSYLDPLRERGVFTAVDVPVRFPLQEADLGGIGEQMSWLGDRVEAAESDQEPVTDGGQYRDPLADVDGLEKIDVECAVAIENPDACDGWEATIELDEPAEFNTDTARISLPGFSWECPKCGNPHEFEIEGIRVSNLV